MSFGDMRSRYFVGYDRSSLRLQPLTVGMPTRSLQQAAMDTLTDSFAMDQLRFRKRPEQPERPIVYTRGVYRPQPVYWKARPENLPADDNEANRNRSPELDLQDNYEPFVVDSPQKDQETKLSVSLNQSGSTPGSERKSAFVPVQSSSKRSHHRPSYRLRSPRRGWYVTTPAQREDPRLMAMRRPVVTEPGPVDFNEYGIVARLWMERVDIKTVQKSKTMYLSVMPHGSRPPEQLIDALRRGVPSPDDTDGGVMPPQWVIVRSRSIMRRRQKQLERRLMGSLGGADGELDNRPLSPSGRQNVLFFQIGSWWKDVAWTLFDGVQSESETVRMIADIELKNPGRLEEQVRDLMARWWKRRGTEATVEVLRECLDVIGVPYVQEECPGIGRPSQSTSFAFESEPEELDVGEVADTDPNVSRLIRSYKVRSMNASFGPDTMRRSGSNDLDLESGHLTRNISLPPGKMSAALNGSVDSRLMKRTTSSSSTHYNWGGSQTPVHAAATQHSLSRNGSMRMYSSMDSINNLEHAGDETGIRGTAKLKAHDVRLFILR